VVPLVDTLTRVCSNKTTVFICIEKRDPEVWDMFFQEVEKVFSWNKVCCFCYYYCIYVDDVCVKNSSLQVPQARLDAVDKDEPVFLFVLKKKFVNTE